MEVVMLLIPWAMGDLGAPELTLLPILFIVAVVALVMWANRRRP